MVALLVWKDTFFVDIWCGRVLHPPAETGSSRMGKSFFSDSNMFPAFFIQLVLVNTLLIPCYITRFVNFLQELF